MEKRKIFLLRVKIKKLLWVVLPPPTLTNIRSCMHQNQLIIITLFTYQQEKLTQANNSFILLQITPVGFSLHVRVKEKRQKQAKSKIT